MTKVVAPQKYLFQVPRFFLSLYYCCLADGKPTYAVTQKPPVLTFPAQMKFVELGNFYKLPNEGTK